MKYMGSKARHATHIISSMFGVRDLFSTVDGECTSYVEPFVGGANVIDKVPHNLRIGSDINPYLIATLRRASQGWMPPRIVTEHLYNKIKANKDNYDPALVGYVGFALSYGGKFFGGWCRDREGKRDYVNEAFRNAQSQFPMLRGVHFLCCDYRDIDIRDGSVVYCDIPYRGTSKYGSQQFSHDQFWRWAEQIARENSVFVSEYSAPMGWTCIWQKAVASSLTRNTGGKMATEKLWVWGHP